MSSNIALRQAYGEALFELGKQRDDFVVLDADLSGGTKTNIFASKFPTIITGSFNPFSISAICFAKFEVTKTSPLLGPV